MYKDDLKPVDDILRIVNEVLNMTTEPKCTVDTVRIPVNDDQREWLKLHFSKTLYSFKEVLKLDKRSRSPIRQILGTKNG